MRGFIGLLVFLVVVIVAGTVGYNVGVGANLAASGATVVYPAYGWGFGFPFFGLIFGLLFLFLIFGLVGRLVFGGRRGWGMGGYKGWGHGYGHGYWTAERKEVPPFADEMLGRWHRRAHGEPEPTESNEPTNQPS